MIAKQIKKIRIAKKMSAYRLAINSGVKSGTIYNLEGGKQVSVNTLEKVAGALDCEILIKPKKLGGS